jgi:hypothetical protein
LLGMVLKGREDGLFLNGLVQLTTTN